MKPLRAFLFCWSMLFPVVAASPALASYDLSGAWHVTSTPPGVLNHWDVVQAAGALTVTADGGSPVPGTIDEGTGDFALDVLSQYPGCGTNSLTGTVAADSRSFAATLVVYTYVIGSPTLGGHCVTSTSQLSGGRCGNGVVDSGENCDDENNVDGDCCSSSCTLDSAGSACTGDGDVCTDDVCDGAGACTHPDNTAPCSEEHGCGSGTCASGACVLTSFEAAGTSCDLDASVCTVDQCDGSGSCAAGATVDCAPCGYCDAAAGCTVDTTDCTHGGATLSMSLGGTRSRVSASMVLVELADSLGDPTADTSYTLCVGLGGSGRTILSATVDPGGSCDGKPCWTQSGSGFTYKNAKSSRNGITQAKARLHDGYGQQLTLKGRGELLGLPAVFDSAFQPLTIKMIADDGVTSRCWSTPVNDDDDHSTRFKGWVSHQVP